MSCRLAYNASTEDIPTLIQICLSFVSVNISQRLSDTKFKQIWIEVGNVPELALRFRQLPQDRYPAPPAPRPLVVSWECKVWACFLSIADKHLNAKRCPLTLTCFRVG